MNAALAQSDWPSWIQAISALATLVATGILVKVTWDYVILTRRLLVAQTDPVLAVYARISARGANWPEFVVENVGNTTAFDIEFETNWNSLEPMIGKDACESLRKGIAALPARKSVVYDLHEVLPGASGWTANGVPFHAHFRRSPSEVTRLSSEGVISLERLTGLGIEVNADPLRLIRRELDELCQGIGRLVAALDSRRC